MRGYYNDPDATAAAFRGGWFHSGDAAVVHPDGYVEIRDRFKDVIISGGENISSIEVEGVLLRHRADPRDGGGRHAAREMGRNTACLRGSASGRKRDGGGAAAILRATPWRISRYRRPFTSWPNCRRPPPARSRNSCCAAGPRRSFGSDPRGGAPSVRARLDRFQMTGAKLAALHDHHELAPVVDEVVRPLLADAAHDHRVQRPLQGGKLLLSELEIPTVAVAYLARRRSRPRARAAALSSRVAML